MRNKHLAAIGAVILFVPALLLADVYTLNGTLTFNHSPPAGTVGTGPRGTGAIPFPPDTLVVLMHEGDIVAKAVAKASGRYTLSHDVKDINSNYRLCVWLQTVKWSDKKDLSEKGHKERVNVKSASGRRFEWAIITDNAFKFRDANSSKALTVNIHVGNNSDRDSTVAGGRMTLRQLSLRRSDADEAFASRLCALLIVIDTAYREVEASKRIPWLGTMHDQATEGQEVFCPSPVEDLATGGICWPAHFDIHVRDSDGSPDRGTGMAATAAHEFGHAVYYHTTAWKESDLARRHNAMMETDPVFAIGEGWPEYFAAAFIDRHQNLLDLRDVKVQEDLNFVRNTRNGYWHYWRGEDLDGTDNSGEVVEGAVAQTFWTQNTPGRAISFVDMIEPVWSILRTGATAKKRNKMKTFKKFYDTWMATNTGSDAANSKKRQDLRDACETHGIVYTRSWLKSIEPVAGSKDISKASDKVWVSAVSRVQANVMDKDDLKVAESNNDIEELSFEISNNSQTSPFDWKSVREVVISGSANWNSFDTDNTPKDEWWGRLDAAKAGLNNRYYLVRSRASKFGGKDTSCEDKLEGPLLRNDRAPHRVDTSGKTTAEWWELLGIHHQIKVDAIPPVVSGRKPASN